MTDEGDAERNEATQKAALEHLPKLKKLKYI